jgi:hypothetical protein
MCARKASTYARSPAMHRACSYFASGKTATTRRLSTQIHCAHGSAEILVRYLRNQGVVQQVGREITSSGRTYAPVYAQTQKDVPPPKVMLHSEMVLKTLQESPKTLWAICLATGLSSKAASSLLGHLRSTVYIHSWVPPKAQRGKPIAVWAFGPNEDAPFPKKENPK